MSVIAGNCHVSRSGTSLRVTYLDIHRHLDLTNCSADMTVVVICSHFVRMPYYRKLICEWKKK